MADRITTAITDRAERSRKAVTRLKEDIAAILTLRETEHGAFHVKAAGVFGRAVESLGAGGATGEADQAQLAIAEAVAEAGRNAFRVLAAQAGISAQQTASYARVAALYNDVLCTLRTGRSSTGQVLDLDGLLGAANCSSTGGGAPASPGGWLQALFASTGKLGITVSSTAWSQLGVWRADVLGRPTASAAWAGQALRSIADGITL